jgi:signal transduction histidine kinase
MGLVIAGKMPAVHDAEVEIERPDGSRVTVVVNIRPLKNQHGKITGAINCFYDITERNRAAEKLAQAQEQLADRAAQLEQLVTERTARLQDTIAELEHFSYTITHDMRAPLRAMQGFASMLVSESADRLPPEGADYLRRIINAARRMDALIQDSLQYAKVVREKIPLEPVEASAVLRSVMESYPNLQGPLVEISVAEPLPAVIANDTGLGQCFANLLVNAAKFVAPGTRPKIRVWAETRSSPPMDPPAQKSNNSPIQHSSDPAFHQSNGAGLVRFWFEDNGIGIPARHQERIFGMFQKLDKSHEGTGIGLALVRKTVERMGGRVGVESAPGEGSRFWLELKQAHPPIHQSNNPISPSNGAPC